MYCPHCGRSVPDDLRFCPYCAGELAQPSPATSPQAAPTPPMPAVQPPVARDAGARSRNTATCVGLGCAALAFVVIAVVGFVGYLAVQGSDTPADAPEAADLDASGSSGGAEVTPADGGEEERSGAGDLSGFVGTWDVVYCAAEGPPPAALRLELKGDALVGELEGRLETHLELTKAADGSLSGRYTDSMQPSGFAVTVEQPGRDRLRLIDQDMPDGPAVFLVADRPGGSDLGPQPRAETEDEALEVARSYAEVAYWLAAGESGRRHVEVEETLDEWFVVHAYEASGSGAKQTFHRYFVFKASAVVMQLE